MRVDVDPSERTCWFSALVSSMAFRRRSVINFQYDSDASARRKDGVWAMIRPLRHRFHSQGLAHSLSQIIIRTVCSDSLWLTGEWVRSISISDYGMRENSTRSLAQSTSTYDRYLPSAFEQSLQQHYCHSASRWQSVRHSWACLFPYPDSVRIVPCSRRHPFVKERG